MSLLQNFSIHDFNTFTVQTSDFFKEYLRLLPSSSNRNFTFSHCVEFLLSGEQNDVKFYLVMLPNDIRKNKLEIKNITVALKWVFVICQKYEVQTFRCELFELTTLVSLETNYFLQTLCLKYGYFSLKHQKKKDLDFHVLKFHMNNNFFCFCGLNLYTWDSPMLVYIALIHI